jgi:hypothetical protein
MREMVAEGEMLAIEADEEAGEHENDEQRGAKQNDDQEKVRLFRRELLYFHAIYDARSLVRRWHWE